MNFTWITIVVAIGALFVFAAMVALAASFLYRNRPEPDEQTYFWDDK
ncbi:MAG: hypothetical protein KDB00_08190 [Planctomycetales bacterium]|nr:hypothetical protein [Planctomycetales bacterium]